MNEAPKPGSVITHNGVKYLVRPEYNRGDQKCAYCHFQKQNDEQTFHLGQPRIACPGPPCQNYNRSYEGLPGVIFLKVESEASNE